MRFTHGSGGNDLYNSTAELCAVNLAAFDRAGTINMELPRSGEERKR